MKTNDILLYFKFNLTSDKKSIVKELPCPGDLSTELLIDGQEQEVCTNEYGYPITVYHNVLPKMGSSIEFKTNAAHFKGEVSYIIEKENVLHVDAYGKFSGAYNFLRTGKFAFGDFKYIIDRYDMIETSLCSEPIPFWVYKLAQDIKYNVLSAVKHSSEWDVEERNEILNNSISFILQQFNAVKTNSKVIV